MHIASSSLEDSAAGFYNVSILKMQWTKRQEATCQSIQRMFTTKMSIRGSRKLCGSHEICVFVTVIALRWTSKRRLWSLPSAECILLWTLSILKEHGKATRPRREGPCLRSGQGQAAVSFWPGQPQLVSCSCGCRILQDVEGRIQAIENTISCSLYSLPICMAFLHWWWGIEASTTSFLLPSFS